MKMIVLISTLIFLTGCAIQDCRLRPHVEVIEPERQTEKSDSDVSIKQFHFNKLQSYVFEKRHHQFINSKTVPWEVFHP